MNCPNCGAPEKTRIRICPECDHVYVSKDLQELRQLEYLLAEASSWQIDDSLLLSYKTRREQLLDQMHLAPESAEAPQEESAEEAVERQPFVEIHAKTKVFRGPGTSYEQLGFAAIGKRAAVLGVSQNSKWWVIKVPTSAATNGQGWISVLDVTAHNTIDVPVIQAPSIRSEVKVKPAAEKPEPAPPEPPKEKVPFDQWLLSERNIKIALYSGGLLLLIAGIIFIGVNWTRIPGPGKFAITLLITGLMYLGGYLLVQRPAYKIGGAALLGIASGFFVLNFAVLQIYVMGPRGMSDIVMWLIASPFCLLLYMLTAYWTKSDLFTYFSIFAIGSIFTAALVLVGAAELIYLLTFALFALVLLVVGHKLRGSQLEDFTCQPIEIVAHFLAPVTFLWSLAILILGRGLLPIATGNPWMSLAILVTGSIFYVLNAAWHQRELPTYLSLVALMICLSVLLVLLEAPLSAFLLSYASMAVLMLVLAHLTRNTTEVRFVHRPLQVLANITMAMTYLAALIYLIVPVNLGSLWFTLIVFGLGSGFYLLNAIWTRQLIFSYAGLVAIAGLGFGVLYLLNVPLLVYPLGAASFALVCVILARLIQDTAFQDILRFPLLSTSQVIMPFALFAAIAGWISHDLITENPWLPLVTLALGVLFYIFTDGVFKRLEARWAFAVLIPITLGLTFYELSVSMSFIGIASMVIAALYLGIGYGLEKREHSKTAGLPLYATAYAISGLVTILAIPDISDLTKILIADVVILVISAAIHRVYWWVYGAVWLFMLPVYFVISTYVPQYHYQGLLLGLLALNYAAAGYLLGRRELRLGVPFLLAAAFLSVITIILTWTNPITATFVMIIYAALYILAALWLGWVWLLSPGLVLINLVVFTTNMIIFGYEQPIEHSLVFSYTALGVAYLLGGLSLRRSNQEHWAWPLYILGTITAGAAYIGSLVFLDWMTIAISVTTAALMFTFAWLERNLIFRLVKFPLLTYLGIGVLFIGHYLLLSLINGESDWVGTWPIYTAGLCALLIALAWLLKRNPFEEIYSIPLRWSGLGLMAVPMLWALMLFLVSLTSSPEPQLVAITYVIAGVAFICDSIMRRSVREAYLGISASLIVIWAVLYALNIYEPQAYIVPVGLIILGVGWYEKTREHYRLYKFLTYTGLFVLMGSAFIQSIPRGAYIYAILVAVEGILAVVWGMRTHCRCFVQVGGFALIAIAVVQLGPGFIDLPRWIQIGLTGAILLGGGMAALFKREQIINSRRRLTDEWRQWNP